MNQGMFMQIQDYLTSIDSRLGQLITEQKRTNELLAAGAPQAEAAPDPADTEPWEGYDEMNIGEVLTRLSILLLSDEELAGIRDYEMAHKNRRGVLDVLGDQGE